MSYCHQPGRLKACKVALYAFRDVVLFPLKALVLAGRVIVEVIKSAVLSIVMTAATVFGNGKISNWVHGQSITKLTQEDDKSDDEQEEISEIVHEEQACEVVQEEKGKEEETQEDSQPLGANVVASPPPPPPPPPAQNKMDADTKKMERIEKHEIKAKALEDAIADINERISEVCKFRRELQKNRKELENKISEIVKSPPTGYAIFKNLIYDIAMTSERLREKEAEQENLTKFIAFLSKAKEDSDLIIPLEGGGEQTIPLAKIPATKNALQTSCEKKAQEIKVEKEQLAEKENQKAVMESKGQLYVQLKGLMLEEEALNNALISIKQQQAILEQQKSELTKESQKKGFELQSILQSINALKGKSTIILPPQKSGRTLVREELKKKFSFISEDIDLKSIDYEALEFAR